MPIMMHPRTALITLAVLLLVMLCPSSDAAIEILELVDPETPVNQQLYLSGLHLVLHAGSHLPNGQSVSFTSLTDVTSDNIVSKISAAGAAPMMMLAPSNATTILAAVDSNSTLNNLVFFAPFTEGNSLRMWSEKLYFTRADLQSELLALLIHCLKTSGPRNVGFMYLSGSDQGEYAFNLLQTEMNLLGTHFISLYAADVADNFSEWQFNAFMRGQPTVVFVFGVEGAHTTDFFTHLIVDPTAISLGISVMLPMLLLHSLSSAYVQTVATLTDKSAIVPSGNVLFSSTNPVWTDGRFAATQAFHDAVNASSPGVITETDPVSLTLAASGWIAGSVLMDALQLYGGSGAAGFQKGIFGQNRYVVGTDLVIGDFGGDMDWMAVSQGATTKCNQGGHLVTVNRLDVRVPYSAEEVTSALAAPLSFVNVWNQPSSDFTYPLSTCYVDTVQIALPVVTLVLNLEDQPSEMTTNQQMASVFQNAVLPLNAHAFGAYTLTTTTSNVVTAVQSDWSSYYRVLMTGVMPMDVTYRDVFVLDPIPLQTSLRVVNPNVVYLSPTLEQQMFVIASFLGTASLDGASDNIYAIVRSPSQAAAIINMITLSLKTFDKSLTSSDTLSATARSEGVGGLEATLKSRGVSLVVGLLESEVATLAVFLKGHPSAYVVVVFEEFVRFYSSFVDAFSTEDSDVQQRLVFATNLPAWNGLTSPQLPQSVEVAEFLTWNPSAHNPAALRAFVLERAVDGLVGSTPVVTSSSLESTLYYKSSFNGAGLPFGSYRNNCTLGSVASSCLYNYGAQNIVVWSFATLTSGHVLQGAMTPNMVYTSKTSSNKSLLLYYIIAAVLGGLLLLVLLFLIFFCCCRARNTRDNHNAPKDASKPVTLIFTDIESSTALWATVPEEMSRAVTDHHRLIRELIAKYRCYEVKTIGDAFMIASSDAHASVMLARDLQKAFMRHDWGGRGIDEAYQSFYRAKGEEIGLTPVEYKRSWNGLRVRVGIHTGTSDIRYDEVTKGYDYYGETSNIAARTESLGAGGQVLMTEYVLDALTDEQRRSLPRVTRLGPHFLRGVSHAIVMYQLDVIGSRQFPVLVSRGEPYSVSVLPADVGNEAAKMACASSEGSPLEDEDGDAEDDPRRSSISSTSSSYRDTRGAVSNIFDVLAIYYSPYPPKERKKLLERACRQFGLSVINPDIYDSDREHAEALLQLLAERTASVLAYRNPEPDSLDRATSPIAMPSTSWGETQTVTGPKKWSSSSNNTADEEQLSSLAIGDFPLESSGLRSGVSPLASSPTSEPEFVTGGSVQKSRVLPRRVGTAPPRSGSGSVVEDPLGNPVWNDLSVSNLSNPAVAEDEIEEATPPRTDEMLNQRRETLPGSSLFRNGQPTFSGDKVVSCFSTGNGLLFRLQDTRTGTWAFYNDTTNYHMTVHFSLGKRSRVTPLGRTQMLEDPSTHRYDGELVIAPLATEMLFAGSVNGYSMRYNGAMVSR